MTDKELKKLFNEIDKLERKIKRAMMRQSSS